MGGDECDCDAMILVAVQAAFSSRRSGLVFVHFVNVFPVLPAENEENFLFVSDSAFYLRLSEISS